VEVSRSNSNTRSITRTPPTPSILTPPPLTLESPRLGLLDGLVDLVVIGLGGLVLGLLLLQALLQGLEAEGQVDLLVALLLRQPEEEHGLLVRLSAPVLCMAIQTEYIVIILDTFFPLD